MARVGYFEGTDPLLLAKLAAEGVETLPLSNGWDGHGKYVNHLKKGEANVVVGYLHKVIPAEQEHMKPADMLFACKNFDIPVVLVVPAAQREKAKMILADAGPNVYVAAPDELEPQIRKHL
ncbi:hypothetical protein [[Eubacterium] cellulosolvens]